MTNKPKPSLPYQGRHWVVMICIVGVFAVLAARAGYLMVIDQEFLQRQGDARILRTEPIMAMRGVIRDRNGTPLAVSTPVTTLWMNPREALAANVDLDALAKHIAMSPAALKKRVRNNQTKQFIYLQRHMSPAKAAEVLAKRFPGVYDLQEYRRFYPEADATAHIIGFTDLEDNGREGLELALNDVLAGQPGSKRVVKDRLGNRVKDVALLKAARPGQDVHLSIDARVQYAAFRELARGVTEHNASAGVLVSLDVETGEVLAMVNMPAYNPNNRSTLTNNALRNRAVTDMFEPGSTVKTFTVIAALESGKYTSRSLFDTNPGNIRVVNKTIRDHSNYGMMDLATLLSKSSNVASAQIAMALPRNTLPLLHYRLGFGARTNSGFPGESAGILQPPERWNPVEVATMSYGYGMTVTALQMAQAYAIVASGGIRRPVSFLKVDGPVEGERVVDESIARSLIPMLESVISKEGTAMRAAVPGYRVAGKTGTAHKASGGSYARDQYMSTFVGLAPVSAPKVVTVVVIDNPRAGGYYGGVAAAPVFSRVMSETLRLMNIDPDRSAERMAEQIRLPHPSTMVTVNPGGLR